MLVKINLLPPYYLERKKIRVAWVVVVTLLVAEIAGLWYFGSRIDAQARALEPQIAQQQAEQQRRQKLQQDAQNIDAQLADRQAIVNFIRSMFEFNNQRPALYEQTANYIHRNVTVLGMGASSTQLTVEVYASNLMDLAAFFRYMHNHPGITGYPTISAIPAYAAGRTRREGAAGGIGELPPSFGPPGAPGANGPMGANGPGGIGFSPTDAGYGMPSGYPGAPEAGYGAGNGPGSAMMGPMMGGANGPEGMPGGAGGQRDSGIPGIRPDRLPPGLGPRGMQVTLTAALAKQIVRPTYKDSEAQIGSSGGSGYGPGGGYGFGGGANGPGGYGPGGGPNGPGGYGAMGNMPGGPGGNGP